MCTPVPRLDLDPGLTEFSDHIRKLIEQVREGFARQRYFSNAMNKLGVCYSASHNRGCVFTNDVCLVSCRYVVCGHDSPLLLDGKVPSFPVKRRRRSALGNSVRYRAPTDGESGNATL